MSEMIGDRASDDPSPDDDNTAMSGEFGQRRFSYAYRN